MNRHGEIMLSFDTIEFKDAELKKTNHKKKGHQFVYSETFMES